MVQSMVSEIVICLMVWANIPHMGTLDPLGLAWEKQSVHVLRRHDLRVSHALNPEPQPLTFKT